MVASARAYVAAINRMIAFSRSWTPAEVAEAAAEAAEAPAR